MDKTTQLLQSPGKKGYLYYCEKAATTCSAIDTTGYYLDEENVYTCQFKDDLDLKCKVDAKPRSKCNRTSVGKLGLDRDDLTKLNICLSYDSVNNNVITAKLSDTSSNYLLNYDANNNIFNLKDTTEYALISANNSSITLNTSCTKITFIYN